jgi:predicted permease
MFRRKAEQELDDELRASIDLLAEEHVGRGVEAREALRLARIELGGVEQIKEEVRAARGFRMLDSSIRDLHHGVRNLARAPGFSIAVVVTLGLALGANASVLALLDRLILRLLPVKQPGGLVIVNAPRLPERPTSERRSIVVSRSANGRQGLSYPLYAALRSRAPGFAGMLAQTHATATLMVEGSPVSVQGRLVTGNYFEVLGVKAALGRLLTPEDDDPPAGSPVVLSHGLWQRQFGGNPAILNRTLHLNRYPVTVVGVAAQGFTGTAAGAAPGFFAPLRLADELSGLPAVVKLNSRFDSPDLHMYEAMARMAPGLDRTQAEQAADQVYQQLVAEALGPGAGAARARRDYEKRRAEFRLQLLPGGYASSEQSSLSQDLRTPLLLLMAMVGLVLAIAVGNVANLFLARGEARSREIAIRFALGASRWRVLRAALVESLLLTCAAGALGLLLARWTTRFVPAVLSLERLPDGVTPAPDLRIAVAVMALSLAAGLCIWAASARALGRATLMHVQHGFRRTLRWRRALVVAQTALSIVLLCGSAVLSRSLIRLMSVDPGFRVDDLYSFWLHPG